MSYDVNERFKEMVRDWANRIPLRPGDNVVDANTLRGQFRFWSIVEFPNSYIVSQKLFTEILKEFLTHRRSANGMQFFLSDHSIKKLRLKENKDEEL